MAKDSHNFDGNLKLQEYKIRLEQTLDGTNCGTFYHDFDRGIIHYDVRSQKHLGINASEVLFDEWLSICHIHPDDIKETNERIANGLEHQKKHISVSYRVVVKGSVRYLKVDSIVKYSGNKPISAYGIILDATERKRSEQALKESEARLKSYYNATFEGIAITEQGKIVDCNRQLAEILGYENDELIGKDAMGMVAAEDRERVYANIQSGYQKPYNHKALKKDGSLIHVEVHGQQIKYEGRPARVTAINDITQKRIILPFYLS